MAPTSVSPSRVTRSPNTDFDPVSAKIAQQYPSPNLPGLYNNYYWVDRQTQPGKWFNGKIDYNITSSQRLTGNLEVVPAGLGYPAADPLIDNNGWDIKEYQSEITDVWTISPRLVGEFRISIAREHGAYRNVDIRQGLARQAGAEQPRFEYVPDIYSIEGTLSPNRNRWFGVRPRYGGGLWPFREFHLDHGEPRHQMGGELPRIGTMEWRSGRLLRL